MSTSLLANLTVVACEHAVAGPFATRQLADLGARVIKIERPGTGDFARKYDGAVRGMSSHFVWLNRGKQSLTLDLKTEPGQRILSQLLASADVFVQNLAPGALRRLGFGIDALREQFPRLVICDISGYGCSGPWQSRKAYDLLVQAEAGLISITGSADQPAKAGIAVADIAAAMYAFSGILAALFGRERTGTGTVVEVSLLDSLAEWMGYPFYYARYGGSSPPRRGASHATIAPYGPFLTRDEKTLMLAVQNDNEWVALCTQVLKRPDLARDTRLQTNSLRVTNRVFADQVVSEGIHKLTLADAVELCEAARIAYGQANDVCSLERHPQLIARQRWTAVDSPVGHVTSLLPPITVRDAQPVIGPIPAVGEHSERILHELGYSAEQIQALRGVGIV